jgi:hypothetical protein
MPKTDSEMRDKLLKEGWVQIGNRMDVGLFSHRYLMAKGNQVAVVGSLDKDYDIPPTTIPVVEKKEE